MKWNRFLYCAHCSFLQLETPSIIPPSRLFLPVRTPCFVIIKNFLFSILSVTTRTIYLLFQQPLLHLPCQYSQSCSPPGQKRSQITAHSTQTPAHSTHISAHSTQTSTQSTAHSPPVSLDPDTWVCPGRV